MRHFAYFVLLGLSLCLPAAWASLPQVAHGNIVRLSEFTSAYVPTRPVDVWLPSGYNPTQRYAVLYMHDGQMLFDASQSWNKQSWQVADTAERLQQRGQVRPFIVVGIHNAGAARHSEYFPQKPFASLPASLQQRLYQLQAADREPLFAVPVYADQYLNFLVKELKPYIDQHFSTDPTAAATFIAGSSMGGLISWYAVTEYPEVFGGAAALSTHWPGSIDIDNNLIPDAFLH